MRRNNLADLVNRVDRIEVISTDVFDTLLPRTGRPERSRILKGERLSAPLATSISSRMPGNREGDALVLSKAESNLIAAGRWAARVTEHFTKLGH